MEQTEHPTPQWVAWAVALVIVGLLGWACAAGRSASAPSDSASGPTQASWKHYDTDITDRAVTALDFQVWPFAVQSGTLHCRRAVAVTFTARGVEYGINGFAKDMGYPSPDAIWADDPDLGNGLKVDISEVLDAGRALC
jgi:Protein of unknown function (DUF2511)